jgi:nucleotide-binding universal stress UspA family protein
MILLCYDGSETATHAITVAHELLGDVPATVLHLWDPPANYLPPDPAIGLQVWSPGQMAELESVILERATKVLEEGVALANKTGFAAQGRLERTIVTPWRAILDIADELDAQSIVVGARGLSAVEAVVLGGVSNAVVHHAKRPVLVVPKLS